MRANRFGVWALALGLLLAAGCKAGVQWRYYAPFRVMGKERAVCPVDPAEVSYAGVLSKLHYVSLTVDGVFFRNLPLTIGKQVAMGIELTGALSKQAIKAVSEPVAARGPNGELFFERPFSVEPFLYLGLPLRLKFELRDVTPAEATNLKGRLQALGFIAGAAKLLPTAMETIKQFSTAHDAFLGRAHKDKVYSYTFSLFPSDMEGVRQDLILTGGRHVFVGIPSSSAPAKIKKLRPADIAYKLRLVGRRLEWRHNNKDYTESPYVIISVIRYKRYPMEDTSLRKNTMRLEKFVEEENWKMAKATLPDVRTAILQDRVITQLEKNLSKSWADLREAQIDGGIAKDKDGQLDAKLRQIKMMGHIGKDFQAILEPFEVKKLTFDIKRISRQALELVSDTGQPPDEVQAITKTALASIKPPPEPPANPILSLKPPKVVTVTITRPEPFYKKWWFYALLGVAGAGLLTGTTAAVLNSGSTESAIIFPGGKPRR